MKLTKAQGIQTLKTISVLLCSQEFRNTVVKSLIDNTQEVLQGGATRYPYLMKNQPTLALARCYLDTVIDSIEVARAYELSDIGLESSRKLLNTVIETYKDQLGWTDQEFNELTDSDYTRLTLLSKIQIMIATPREGSKYFEGEAIIKEVLKPFMTSFTEARDATVEAYSEAIPAFFSYSDQDYISVGKGKVVHKDLYDKYMYQKSVEYYVTEKCGLNAENAKHFLDLENDRYHFPSQIAEYVGYYKSHDIDSDTLNRFVTEWLSENTVDFPW